MGIGFNSFVSANREETPDFIGAAAAEGRQKQAIHAQAQALRSQQMMGAAELYNEGMGDSSPIADAMFGEADPFAGYNAEQMADQVAADQVGIESGAEAWMPPEIGPQSTIPEVAGGEVAGGELVAGEVAGGELVAGELVAGEVAAAELAAAELAAAETAGGVAAAELGGGVAAAELGGGLMAGASATMPYLAAALAAYQMFA